MLKKALPRIINGFMYGTAITAIVTAIVTLSLSGSYETTAVVPEFAERIGNSSAAALLQCVISGIIGAAFSGGSVIFENPRWGRLRQWFTYFIITSAVYIPAGFYCWGAAVYPRTRISMVISFSATYFIIWIVEYLICKKNIKEINAELKKLHKEGGISA